VWCVTAELCSAVAKFNSCGVTYLIYPCAETKSLYRSGFCVSPWFLGYVSASAQPGIQRGK